MKTGTLIRRSVIHPGHAGKLRSSLLMGFLALATAHVSLAAININFVALAPSTTRVDWTVDTGTVHGGFTFVETITLAGSVSELVGRLDDSNFSSSSNGASISTFQSSDFSDPWSFPFTSIETSSVISRTGDDFQFDTIPLSQFFWVPAGYDVVNGPALVGSFTVSKSFADFNLLPLTSGNSTSAGVTLNWAAGPAAAIPEPSAAAALAGLLALGAVMVRRRRSAQP